MDVFDLAARITLDTSAYETGLAGLGTMAGGAARAIGLAFVAATGAVVGFGASSVKAGAEFDKSMSQVAATLGTTVEGMENEVGSVSTAFGEFNGNLREFAQFMGANTAFSATQAADALNYMALAGYDAQKSMNMLPSVLSLAAAGTMDLATASDMVTDAQTALGLDMDQTTALVDKMARAASRSNTSVSQMGSAILTIGGTAQFMNGTILELANGEQVVTDKTTELSMVLGVLADNGIKGSEAGTHLRNALLKLSGDNTTKGMMEDIGVAIFDAEGKMRSFADIFPELNEAISDWTDEEKLSFFAKAFNVRDVASMNALLNTSRERWAELGYEIQNSAGAAEEMAATQLDNLAGDVTIFKSALEGAKIAISDRLTPTLRDFVQMGTEGVSNISSAFKEGGLESAMGAFGDWLSGATNAFVEAVPMLVSAAGQLLSAFGKGIVDNADTIISAADQLIEFFLNGIIESENAEGGGKAVQIIQNIVNMLVDNLPLMARAAQSLVRQLGRGLSGAIRTLAPTVTSLVVDLVKFFTDPQTIIEIVNAGVDIMLALVQGITDAFPVIVSALPEIIQNLVTALTQGLPVLIDGIVNMVNMVMENAPIILSAITDALPQIIEMIVDAIIVLLPLIIEGNIRIMMAIAEHLPEIIKVLIDALPVVIDSILQGLSRLGDALITWLSGVFDELGAYVSVWWSGKQEQIKGKWDEFIAQVKQWFDQLPYNIGVALANMYLKILDFADDFYNWITIDLPNLIDDFIYWFIGLPNSIWNYLIEIVDNLTDWGEAMKLKAEEVIPLIISEIEQFFKDLIDNAWDWGWDMIDQFFAGIKNKWDGAKGFIDDIAQGFKDTLGHSHPVSGPMADDYTWMPDMMDLFIQGIKDNEGRLQDQIEDTFNIRDQVADINAGGIEVTGGDVQRIGTGSADMGANQPVTVVLELDKVKLAETVFTLNKDESQRMGVQLAYV